MIRSSIGFVLFFASLLLTSIAGIRWQWRAAGDARPVANHPPHAIGMRAPTTAALDESVERLVDNDPFRLSNTPADRRFDLSDNGSSVGATGASPTLVPRPLLVLRAIVGGPPWQAVIDGLPGRPAGTIASPGSRFDRLVVRMVTPDSVVIQSPDTTWVLRFTERS